MSVIITGVREIHGLVAPDYMFCFCQEASDSPGMFRNTSGLNELVFQILLPECDRNTKVDMYVIVPHIAIILINVLVTRGD